MCFFPSDLLPGGHLFTHDVLASAQSGNTIAMFLFDWSICEANQRLRAWPQSTPLSKDRYRINNKFFKRTTDLFIASMRDSHGKHLPAGANYSMNKKENIPQKSMTGRLHSKINLQLIQPLQYFTYNIDCLLNFLKLYFMMNFHRFIMNE